MAASLFYNFRILLWLEKDCQQPQPQPFPFVQIPHPLPQQQRIRMSQIRLSLPHPQPQSLPLLQHKRIKISQKQLLKPQSLPHPQPEEQEFWQFVAAKSLMGSTPRFLITVYSMHYHRNVSFLVKKFLRIRKMQEFSRVEQ